ncbi:MAG: pyridoxal phosphate-dependent aminotransferase [Bacteroidales bacterium]|nr:pyridoxal phosphate-dependent aminotransferase [Bacteroidales bacterium]MCF8391364.1 pyridoxal phosphate-dependent aminotransferase [Bacteroidales bacterium]
MENVSKRLASLSPSATIAMNQKSTEMKNNGIDVVNLSVGEPDFPTPDNVKAAAKKAIDENYSFYAPVPGYPALRKAIVEKFKRENNLEYTADQIVVSTGAKHSIANVLMSIIDPGDEVIVPSPYWVSYPEQVKIAEGVNVIVDAGIESEYKITPKQLENAITSKTKALMLCSPSNPSGSLYSREELAALVEVLKKHPDVFIISDEIYEHINFSGTHVSIAEFPEVFDRTVVVNGVSKGYAMTGWRIGYIGAPLWIAKACSKLQGQMTSGATSIAQMAAIEALNGDQSCIADMKMAFKRRRDYVLDRMSKIQGIKCTVPDGAFYVYPDMSFYFGKKNGSEKINSSMDLCLYLLEKGRIATVPGSAFGSPNNVRISYATSDENLVKAMDRLEEALKGLV